MMVRFQSALMSALYSHLPYRDLMNFRSSLLLHPTSCSATPTVLWAGWDVFMEHHSPQHCKCCSLLLLDKLWCWAGQAGNISFTSVYYSSHGQRFLQKGLLMRVWIYGK